MNWPAPPQFQPRIKNLNSSRSRNVNHIVYCIYPFAIDELYHVILSHNNQLLYIPIPYVCGNNLFRSRSFGVIDRHLDDC